MTWRGWDNFSPGDTGQAAQAKRAKYAAEHVFVTEDLTLFTRAEILTLAERQGIALDCAVTTKRGPGRKAMPLAWLAEQIGLRGLVFASRREGGRWLDLRTRERFHLIADLRRQVPYALHKDAVVIATYIADFVYLEDGTLVVEDSKGYRTREYLRKRRLFEAEYGTKIRET
jgi:hypothetical protein